MLSLPAVQSLVCKLPVWRAEGLGCTLSVSLWHPPCVRVPWHYLFQEVNGSTLGPVLALWRNPQPDQIEFSPNLHIVTVSHESFPFSRSGVFPVIGQISGANSLSREGSKVHLVLPAWVCFRRKVISSVDSEDDWCSVYCLIPLPVCEDADTSVHHLVTALLFHKPAVKASLLSRISLCTKLLNRALETCYCSCLCSCS